MGIRQLTGVVAGWAASTGVPVEESAGSAEDLAALLDRAATEKQKAFAYAVAALGRPRGVKGG